MCNFCNHIANKAIFWKDKDNNAFVNSKGEMIVTVNGNEAVFQVEHCPMCGRLFELDAIKLNN